MKKLYILLILISYSLAFGNEVKVKESDYQDAMKLSYEFIEKLKENTPFTYEEGRKFFGPLMNAPRLDLILLLELGYLDGYGNPIKELPKYSPLGELIRMNRELFLPDSYGYYTYYQPSLRFTKTQNGFEQEKTSNNIFVYIRMEKNGDSFDFKAEKLLRLEYYPYGKYLMGSTLCLEGQPLMERVL